MKTILITGASGFIGAYLAKHFSGEFKVIGIDSKEPITKICEQFYKMDLSNITTIVDELNKNKIDVIIHTAAAKSLNWCEQNKSEARKINFEITKSLYERFPKSHFIFISSDQVFPGNQQYSMETTLQNPINFYGETKKLCEQFLLSKPNTSICRTAMVVGPLSQTHKQEFKRIRENSKIFIQSYFVQHILFKLNKNQQISIPIDEYCNPTSTNLLYRQIRSVIINQVFGITHCCGKERISRFEFAKKIARFFEFSDENIQPIIDENPLRPKDVSLDVQKTEIKLKLSFDDIQQILQCLKSEGVYS